MKKHIGIVVFAVCIITAWMICETFAQKDSSQAGGFKVERMVVCTKVENREPIDIKEIFSSATEKVYLFVEIRNITEDTTVTAVWRHGDKEMLKTDLHLKKSSRWRTYANKTLYGLKGNWEVDLVSSDGKAVKTITFKVE